MPDTPTPGQTAYEAYMNTKVYPIREDHMWDKISLYERACWEAAAQAVLAWQKENPHA